MPESDPAVDWTLIQAAYISGVPTKEIAEAFNVKPGTIAGRACREKWTRKSIDNSILSLSKIIGNNKDAYLKSASNTVVKAQARIEAIANERGDSMELSELGDLGAVTESFARAAKPIFGLGDNQTVQVGVQVSVLSNLDDIPDAQVIEVKTDV